MVTIKNYTVKKIIFTNFRKDWKKFPEIFRGKFPNSQPYLSLSDGLHMERRPTRLYSSGSGSGVVLRHRAAAAACVCLIVGAAKAVAYTALRRAQRRLDQQMVFCTTTAQIHGVLQNNFSNMVFYKNEDYHPKLFFLPCATIRF